MAIAAADGCSSGSNETSPGTSLEGGATNGSSSTGSDSSTGGASTDGTNANSGGASTGGTNANSGSTTTGSAGTNSSSGGTSPSDGGMSGSDGGMSSSSSGSSTSGGSSGADSGLAGADSGATGDTGVAPAGAGVCDIFASGGTPCMAAHSTVRALYGAYSGSLYQVTRASDNTTTDIGVLSAGSFANSATQDAFCAGTTCTMSILYDQSGKGNNLTPAPPGQRKATPDNPADATALTLTLSGHPVYGLHIVAGDGYRNDKAAGTATADLPETEYMVTSGTFYNSGCCFDYGNAETNNSDDSDGTMEAVYFGTASQWGKGGGAGPWVMADMENGIFAGVSFAANAADMPQTSAYVTGLVIGRSGTFALKGGNSQSGMLTTFYDGARPTGYNPMKKQGAIILGMGGDNTNGAQGNFFEGVMTSGAATDATADAVQANIVAAGYGK